MSEFKLVGKPIPFTFAQASCRGIGLPTILNSDINFTFFLSFYHLTGDGPLSGSMRLPRSDKSGLAMTLLLFPLTLTLSREGRGDKDYRDPFSCIQQFHRQARRLSHRI